MLLGCINNKARRNDRRKPRKFFTPCVKTWDLRSLQSSFTHVNHKTLQLVTLAWLLEFIVIFIFEIHLTLHVPLLCHLAKKRRLKARWTHSNTRGLFLKSPETFRVYLGCQKFFISSQRRGFKPSNFTILLVFIPLKTC